METFYPPSNVVFPVQMTPGQQLTFLSPVPAVVIMIGSSILDSPEEIPLRRVVTLPDSSMPGGVRTMYAGCYGFVSDDEATISKGGTRMVQGVAFMPDDSSVPAPHPREFGVQEGNPYLIPTVTFGKTTFTDRIIFFA